MKYRFIEEKTTSLLKSNGYYTVPILVESLVKSLKIDLEPVITDENVSGFFLTKGAKHVIGYNNREPQQRIRFTIAHELGHWHLHSKEAPLFIDKKEKVRFNRDGNSSTGELTLEREANAYAAALLMPEELLKQEIEKLDQTEGAELVKQLSKKFMVSEQSMAYRLSNLDLIEVGL